METCCAEHEEIARIAKDIRKGTATGCWQPQGPLIEQERWRNRANRVAHERDYRRHLLHCIIAQDGKCGDVNKDPSGKGCGRLLLALPSVSVHVDHIMPRKQGGSDDYHNCQALCSGCNNAAGDGSRKDDPFQIMQREWEAVHSEESALLARKQDGKCNKCKILLYENITNKIWYITNKSGYKTVICNSCGEIENHRHIQLEKEHHERLKKLAKAEEEARKPINRIRKLWETLMTTIGFVFMVFFAGTFLLMLLDYVFPGFLGSLP